MTAEEINALNAAADVAGKAADVTNQENRKLLAALSAIPGGKKMFRRELAKLNIEPALFERCLNNDLPPDELAALMPALAGLKVANN